MLIHGQAGGTVATFGYEKSRTCHSPAIVLSPRLKDPEHPTSFGGRQCDAILTRDANVAHRSRVVRNLSEVLIQSVVQTIDCLHQLTPLVENFFGLKFACFVMAEASFADQDVFVKHR